MHILTCTTIFCESMCELFHFVAIYGSFSVAAERLKISQPAVSEQVKKLEQNYDTLLIRRKNKKITLTDEGKKILLLTKQLFEVEQQIEDYISESGQELAGSIRIIADSASHVLNILAAFRKKYPKVKVILDQETLKKLKIHLDHLIQKLVSCLT